LSPAEIGDVRITEVVLALDEGQMGRRGSDAGTYRTLTLWWPWAWRTT